MEVDVFTIPGKTWPVRYAEDHGWGCAAGDGPLWFSERKIYMPLLPLLEHPFDIVKGIIQSGARNVGLPPAAVESFPFEDLVVYALAWESDGWPKNAINWLKGDFPVTDKISVKLEEVARDTRRGQQLRHAAKALSKRPCQVPLNSQLGTDACGAGQPDR